MDGGAGKQAKCIFFIIFIVDKLAKIKPPPFGLLIYEKKKISASS